MRKRTDVDIFFHRAIYKRVLANKIGFNIKAFAFQKNMIAPGRTLGENHFSKTMISKWDLFYDANHYGFCYGSR